MRLTAVRYDSATTRARAFKLSFISLISLSTSSMNLDASRGQHACKASLEARTG
jgi:hypothetical protein